MTHYGVPNYSVKGAVAETVPIIPHNPVPQSGYSPHTSSIPVELMNPKWPTIGRERQSSAIHSIEPCSIHNHGGIGKGEAESRREYTRTPVVILEIEGVSGLNRCGWVTGSNATNGLNDTARGGRWYDGVGDNRNGLCSFAWTMNLHSQYGKGEDADEKSNVL